MASQESSKRQLRSSTSTIDELNATKPKTKINDKEKGSTPEAVKCRICSEIFVDDSDLLVICDRCENWICLKCSGLSEAQYSSLDNNLQWYCSDCKLPAMQAVKVDRSIEEKCQEYLEAFRIELKTEIDIQLREIREDIKDIRNQQRQPDTAGDKVEVTVQKAVQESIKIQEQELQDRER